MGKGSSSGRVPEGATVTRGTPMRQADERLSNCVLEGGRSKHYASPPPPLDLPTHIDIGSAMRLIDVLAVALWVSLVVVVLYMAQLGCTPFRCP